MAAVEDEKRERIEELRAREREAKAARLVVGDQRVRLIAAGVIVPGGPGAWAAAEERIASLPCLPIDEAGRRVASAPVELTRFGSFDEGVHNARWFTGDDARGRR